MGADKLACTRCRVARDDVGTKKVHAGTRLGVFGELFGLFQNREHFDVYVCPRCGRVELYVDGLGEELRPH